MIEINRSDTGETLTIVGGPYTVLVFNGWDDYGNRLFKDKDGKQYVFPMIQVCSNTLAMAEKRDALWQTKPASKRNRVNELAKRNRHGY